MAITLVMMEDLISIIVQGPDDVEGDKNNLKGMVTKHYEVDKRTKRRRGDL
jgi:hypothetical protein